MALLVIDGANFLHRARAGFNLGEFPVVFNTFRNLRALIEKHAPTRVIFVLEGYPKKRYEMLPEYKANRKIVGDPEDPEIAKKIAEQRSFFRQADLIVDLLTRHFPISVVRHPDHECDDVIYNLIKRGPTCTEWVVASNDTDFIQLLNEFKNVKLYNPMTKEFVETPDYEYVTFKALKGDGSDNISGLPGIGEKIAGDIVNDPDKLLELFTDPIMAEKFDRNYKLIKFMQWTDEEAMLMTSSSPIQDWEEVSKSFQKWSFKSLLKEETWKKFCETFEPLWG